MESSSVERVSALTLLRRQFSSSNQNMITLTPPISEYTLSPQNAEQNRENLYHRSQIQSQQVSTTVLPDNSQMQIQVSIPAFPDDSHMQIQQVSIPVFPNASQMQKQQVPMSVFSNDSQMQKQQVSTPVNINNYHIQKQQIPNFYYQCQPQLQQPQLHHEHQHFNGYCDNYSYTRTPWSNQNQSSNNYVGNDYQPAVHGHTSTMMQQPEGLYYPPQNSYEYNPVNVNYNLPQGHQLPQGLPRPSTIKPRRTRTFYTPYQLLELEKLFVSKKYPIRTERIETSLRLKMTEKQVKVWFQNRRIKLRKAESMGNASPSKSSKHDQTLSCKKENVDIQTLSCKKENADIEDIENINKTIDTEAEAHILREMQDSAEAEAFEKGVIYMTSRPDEISLILDAAEEKLS